MTLGQKTSLIEKITQEDATVLKRTPKVIIIVAIYKKIGFRPLNKPKTLKVFAIKTSLKSLNKPKKILGLVTKIGPAALKKPKPKKSELFLRSLTKPYNPYNTK